MYDEIDYCASCKHYDCEPHLEPCVSCKTKYNGAPTKFLAKQRTNADRIRAMSDEELAKWIDWLFGRCEWCDTDKMATDDCNDVECTSCILEWLKQPAE